MVKFLGLFSPNLRSSDDWSQQKSELSHCCVPLPKSSRMLFGVIPFHQCDHPTDESIQGRHYSVPRGINSTHSASQRLHPCYNASLLQPHNACSRERQTLSTSVRAVFSQMNLGPVFSKPPWNKNFRFLNPNLDQQLQFPDKGSGNLLYTNALIAETHFFCKCISLSNR